MAELGFKVAACINRSLARSCGQSQKRGLKTPRHVIDRPFSHTILTIVTRLFRDSAAGFRHNKTMKPFYRLGILLAPLTLIALLIPVSADAAEELSLNEILAQHWAALGGMQNWSKIESIRLKGTIERGGKTVDILIVKKRPKQIRATLTLPLPGNEEAELQVIRAHDGTTGWTATRLTGEPLMRKELLSPDDAATLLADAGVLPPLIQQWRDGAELQLLQRSEIGGQDLFIIQAAAKNSTVSSTFYLDAENFLLLAHETHHPSDGTTRTSFYDYSAHSGIKLPQRSLIESEATGRSTMTTESVALGVGIYPEYFDAGAQAQTVRSAKQPAAP